MPCKILAMYCKGQNNVFAVICDDDKEVEETLAENCPKKKKCPYIVSPVPDDVETFLTTYGAVMDHEDLKDDGFKPN